MDSRNNCTISIVTVSYNAVDTIEETIQSVLGQDYEAIEYIVVDGGSTDGTVDVIKKYSDKLSYWVSEPDNGVYDAMNKGITVASGQWINFMNSGDCFFSNHVLSDIFNHEISSSVMVIYGDVIKQHSTFQEYVKAKSLFKLNFCIPFCHQSSFVRLVPKLYFDTRFKISADFKLMHDYFHNYGYNSFKYVKFPISVFEAEQGISSTLRNNLIHENLIISKNYFSLFWWYYRIRSFFYSFNH